MASFVIDFDIDNAAFDDGRGGATEVARILTTLALKVADEPVLAPGELYNLRDINGNSVGHATVTGDE